MTNNLILLLIFIVVQLANSSAQELPGDCDHNGIVNYSDVRCMENYLRTLEPDNPESMSYLDLDADCDIDCEDIDYLRAYLLESGPSPLTSHCRHPEIDTCCWQTPGDANLDKHIDISDAVFIANYLFCGGHYQIGYLSNLDANGDCVVSLVDCLYLSYYINAGGPAPVQCTCLEPSVEYSFSCQGMCGDVNCDNGVDITDAVYLIKYLFNNGPPPCPVLSCADVDNSNGREVNLDDAIFIINFTFFGGPAPGYCNMQEWYPESLCCPLSFIK